MLHSLIAGPESGNIFQMPELYVLLAGVAFLILVIFTLRMLDHRSQKIHSGGKTGRDAGLHVEHEIGQLTEKLMQLFIAKKFEEMLPYSSEEQMKLAEQAISDENQRLIMEQLSECVLSFSLDSFKYIPKWNQASIVVVLSMNTGHPYRQLWRYLFEKGEWKLSTR